MIFGLGHYLHAAILRSIFRTMIFCPMDRINCRCKSPFTTFDEKRSILAAEAIKLILRLRCTSKPAAMSSSINVVGDRDGWGPKFLAQMDSKEKAICERRRDFDGRAGREGMDGWMDAV